MGKTATINVRVDEMDKKSAEQVLNQLGMPMSTLVTLLLKQVVLTKSIPFTISLPDADEFGAMMVEAYHEADSGDVQPANDFFKEFREKHK